MKKTFESAELEIVSLTVDDIVTASPGDPENPDHNAGGLG